MSLLLLQHAKDTVKEGSRKYPAYIKQLAKKKLEIWHKLKKDKLNAKLKDEYKKASAQYREAVDVYHETKEVKYNKLDSFDTPNYMACEPLYAPKHF